MPLPKFLELDQRGRDLHQLCGSIGQQRRRLVECLENHHLEIPTDGASWLEQSDEIVDTLIARLTKYRKSTRR